MFEQLVALVTSLMMGMYSLPVMASPAPSEEPEAVQALSQFEYMNIDISTPADGYAAANSQVLTMYFQYSGIYRFSDELYSGAYIAPSKYGFEQSLQHENIVKQFELELDDVYFGTLCKGTARCDLSGIEPGEYTLWVFCYKGSPDDVEELVCAGNEITIFAPQPSDEKGWFQQGEEIYYADGGYLCYGWQSIGGNWYYFDSEGVMVTGWNKGSDDWFYHDMDGRMLTGWQNIGTERYYLSAEDGVLQRGWLQQNDARFYLDANTGAMQTGWKDIKIDGASGRYYFESTGHMATGWRRIDGSDYYFGEDGRMAAGAQAIDGKTYVFTVDGRLTL